MSAIENLEKLLTGGKDSALLRYGLANAHFKAGNVDKALEHLQAAVKQDPDYSAAWKMLGKLLGERSAADEAAEAFLKGIAAAEKNGDIQAVKEMKVFLKRLGKNLKVD